MKTILYHDSWSDRDFMGDPVKVRETLDKICDETNKKIKDGELVNTVDIMNYIYRELGLPEVDFPRKHYMTNRNKLDEFHYDLYLYDFEDERETGLEIDTYFI